MKRSQIIELVREVLGEISTTGTGASFTAGQGEQYATPKAFKGGGKIATYTKRKANKSL